MGCGVKLVIVVGSSSPLEASSPESRAREGEGERETSRRDYTCLRIIWGQRRRPPSPIARNSPPTSPSVRTPPGAAEAELEGEAVRIERAKVSPGGVSDYLWSLAANNGVVGVVSPQSLTQCHSAAAAVPPIAASRRVKWILLVTN